MPTQGSPTRCDSTMPPVPGRTRGTPSWPMRYGELPTRGEATCPRTVIITSSPALIRGEPGLRVGTTDDPVTAASVTPARAEYVGAFPERPIGNALGTIGLDDVLRRRRWRQHQRLRRQGVDGRDAGAEMPELPHQ